MNNNAHQQWCQQQEGRRNNKFRFTTTCVLILAALTFWACLFFGSSEDNADAESDFTTLPRQLQQLIFDPKSLAPRLPRPLISPLADGTLSDIVSTADVIDDSEAALETPRNNNNDLLAFYTKVHTSSHPAAEAGEWIKKSDAAANLHRPSPEHLQCLDREYQGNCHDPEKHRNVTTDAGYEHTIFNSPGIMDANDPWVWRSDNPLYQVMPLDGDDGDDITNTAVA